MALLTHDGLDGLLMAVESARLSEEQLANANRLLGVAVVRAPRTARVVKRRVEQAEEPLRARQAAAKRPKTDATAKNPGVVPAKPRSPDEKRKLSRQMAAFMRYGVLVLPADVKVRNPRAAQRQPHPPLRADGVGLVNAASAEARAARRQLPAAAACARAERQALRRFARRRPPVSSGRTSSLSAGGFGCASLLAPQKYGATLLGCPLSRPLRAAQLNKKVKKADGEVLEGYRKSFNLQLQLVFGESVRAWAHVNNWFYLHAGARPPRRHAVRSTRLSGWH
jgi:hypothetical protein